MEYDAELIAARACKANKKNATCAAMVPAKLGGCGSDCILFVDNANMLEQLRRRWAQAGCVAPACTAAVRCSNAKSSVCAPTTEMCTE